ncbi:hypothetical protein LMH87_001507 [Akanthomyces muscarius]|uniref:Uncharacterized protein n=1 Tax=Akanthomyces muscarius TaxID=2231603 RepID=A0A9W8Q4Y7_AKAMU|nr:hypothetical protein LMH87_001507 [Akanthomyces muscarius]KAJ4146953.1 hypothetical protein LMH87_001507 [Akanthomyces muscarius]
MYSMVTMIIQMLEYNKCMFTHSADSDSRSVHWLAAVTGLVGGTAPTEGCHTVSGTVTHAGDHTPLLKRDPENERVGGTRVFRRIMLIGGDVQILPTSAKIDMLSIIFSQDCRNARFGS